MPDQFNLRVIGSKSGFVIPFNSLFSVYNRLCCCPNVACFYAVTTRLGPYILYTEN